MWQRKEIMQSDITHVQPLEGGCARPVAWPSVFFELLMSLKI